jgi:hypothetical protein
MNRRGLFKLFAGVASAAVVAPLVVEEKPTSKVEGSNPAERATSQAPAS